VSHGRFADWCRRHGLLHVRAILVAAIVMAHSRPAPAATATTDASALFYGLLTVVMTTTDANVRDDALTARAPLEQQGYRPNWADGACTAGARAQLVALFESRAAGLDAGARAYRQSSEKIDLCLVLRAAQDAPLNAFLARQ
jgi:hypothetical protein